MCPGDWDLRNRERWIRAERLPRAKYTTSAPGERSCIPAGTLLRKGICGSHRAARRSGQLECDSTQEAVEAELEAIVPCLGRVGIDTFIKDLEDAREQARSVKPVLPFLHAGGNV